MASKLVSLMSPLCLCKLEFSKYIVENQVRLCYARPGRFALGDVEEKAPPMKVRKMKMMERILKFDVLFVWGL